MKDKRPTVPKEILMPIANKMRLEKQSDPEKWLTYDYERIREACGLLYGSIPIDDLRLQCCNLRKAGLLVKVKGGRGIPKRQPPPAKYLDYLKSDHWKEFKKKLAEFWDYKCALCFSDASCDGHHRTYERLGAELMTDCVLLCRKCHQAADRARQRNAKP